MSAPARPGTGKGGYRRYWQTCSHGHPLSPDPRDPDHRRRCTTCARSRSTAAYHLCQQAAAVLAVPVTVYLRRYGRSSTTASRLIEAAAASS